MTNYLKPLLAFLVVLCIAQSTFANTTNEEIFSNALKAYDRVIEVNKKIYGKDKGSDNENATNGSKITKEQYVELKKVLDAAADLFEQYVRISSNTNNKKVAQFYLLSIKKIDFSSLNSLQQFATTYNKINELSDELSTIRGYYFPLKYKNNGKTYVIEYQSRKDMERQLLVKFTESSAFTYKYADAAKWAKQAYAFYNYGDYNLWWAAHMWFHNYSLQYKYDAEIVESAEKLIYAMSGLKRSEIKTILDSNFANYTHAYSKLNTVLNNKPELSRNGEVWAKAAPSFEKLDKQAWANEYYKKALAAGYGDKTFLLDMMSKGKKENDKAFVKTAAEIFDTKNLYAVYYSCTEYKTIADYFEYAGNNAKKEDLYKKYKECDKALTKQQRRAARGGKFYLSFAPLAPLSKNLQGSIQIGGNRRLHEFGIKQTRSQRDLGWDVLNGDDNPKEFRWDGLSYYYTYKKFIKGSRGGEMSYVGFQLRYTQRNYDAQNVRVKNNTNGSYSNITFNPNETRYDFTVQMGNFITSRFLHMEIYAAMGAGYSIFDGGKTEWNNKNYEITNHNILANREPTRIGLTLRLGLVMGLNFMNK